VRGPGGRGREVDEAMASSVLRVHVRQWRALIWLGTVGLAALAGWNVWQIVQKMQKGEYQSRSSSDFEQIIGGATGSLDETEVRAADWTKDYRALREAPLHGFVKEPPKPVDTTPKEEPVPTEKPITEVLTVTAITQAPDDRGRVVVKYKDDTAKPTTDEVVLKIGAALTHPYSSAPYDGSLKEIRGDTAIFSWFGKDAEVHPKRREESAKTADKTKKGEPGSKSFDGSLTDAEREALTNAKNKEKTIAYAPDSYVVGTKDAAGFAENAEDYLREANIMDRKGADGKREVVVGTIRPGSYLARTYDLQSGDSLISINGTPVSTKTEAYSYVRDHGDLSKYVVVLKRKGREVTKTILVNRDGKK
jgi:hypothetical protein